MTPAQFMEYMASASLQTAIVVAITHWLCRIVHPPNLQSRLWNSCHVLLLVVLIGGLVLPHPRLVNPWPILATDVVRQVVLTESLLGRALFGIWGVGVALCLILLISEWLRVFRFLKSCRPANAYEMSLTTEDGGEHGTFHQGQPVRVLISRHLGSPFCCQWQTPVLVLPEFILDLRSEEVRFVARHELEHLRSGHPLQLFIERLVSIALWFHPAVWWASRQSSLAREYACDDAAVTERHEVVGYLKTLLAIAERGLAKESNGAVLFFGAGAGVVALRGRRLLSRSEAPNWDDRPSRHFWWPQALLAVTMLASWFLWVPLDALASSRTRWSPWPRWSANVLHAFDVPARDFEPYEVRTRWHELSTRSGTPGSELPRLSEPDAR